MNICAVKCQVITRLKQTYKCLLGIWNKRLFLQPFRASKVTLEVKEGDLATFQVLQTSVVHFSHNFECIYGVPVVVVIMSPFHIREFLLLLPCVHFQAASSCWCHHVFVYHLWVYVGVTMSLCVICESLLVSSYLQVSSMSSSLCHHILCHL